MDKNRMNNDDIEPIFSQQEHLLDELQSVLNRQLQLARQGDSTNEQFGVLTGKASSLVREIERTGILDRDDLQHRREGLRRRYENLCLIVAAEKANVCRNIGQIHTGRKILQTYRSNI